MCVTQCALLPTTEAEHYPYCSALWELVISDTRRVCFSVYHCADDQLDDIVIYYMIIHHNIHRVIDINTDTSLFRS